MGTLDGTAEKKALVRSVFVSVVQTPAQTFGAVTSNQPRTKQSDLLSPAELMVLLHEGEKDVGLKPTIEGTCFGMEWLGPWTHCDAQQSEYASL